ncbi:TPA: cupin domain-containing protein [bacterium]|nr:cupin domain-containing protein [bacterium]
MKIGEKLRSLRLKNNLTLSELAARTELTKGFLSQVENDMTSPSIETLSDILEVLGSNIGEFFTKNQVQQIVFTKNDYFENETDDYLIKWIVPSAPTNEMEPMIMEIKPFKKSLVIRPHKGEELGYVLKGKVTLVIGNKHYLVEEGSTFYIEGNQSHYLLNNFEEPCKLIWVSSPPSF